MLYLCCHCYAVSHLDKQACLRIPNISEENGTGLDAGNEKKQKCDACIQRQWQDKWQQTDDTLGMEIEFTGYKDSTPSIQPPPTPAPSLLNEMFYE